MAVGLYAPIVNETYGGGVWNFPYSIDTETFLIENEFKGQYGEISFPNSRNWRNEVTYNPLLAEFRTAFPFSDFEGLRKLTGCDPTLASPPSLEGFAKKIFLFQGTGDTNTTPSQMKNLIQSFSNIEFGNWKLFVYQNSSHWVHRIKGSLESGKTLSLDTFKETYTQLLSNCSPLLEQREGNFQQFINDVCSIPDSVIEEDILESPHGKCAHAISALDQMLVPTEKLVRAVEAFGMTCPLLTFYYRGWIPAPGTWVRFEDQNWDDPT